jgi:hypothetical protein
MDQLCLTCNLFHKAKKNPSGVLPDGVMKKTTLSFEDLCPNRCRVGAGGRSIGAAAVVHGRRRLTLPSRNWNMRLIRLIMLLITLMLRRIF